MSYYFSNYFYLNAVGKNSGVLGTQVVGLSESTNNRTHFLARLDGDGNLSIDIASPKSDGFFTSSFVPENIINEVIRIGGEDAKILEIAGKKGILKVRITGGIAIEFFIYGAASQTLKNITHNVGRITADKNYKLSGDCFYSNDKGTLPMMDGNIVAVFDGGGYGDIVAMIDNSGIIVDGKNINSVPVAAVGKKGNIWVSNDGVSFSSLNGDGTIDGVIGYGYINYGNYRNNIGYYITHTESCDNPFSAESFNQWLAANGKCHKNEWTGFGKTGYVVDAPEEYIQSPTANKQVGGGKSGWCMITQEKVFFTDGTTLDVEDKTGIDLINMVMGNSGSMIGKISMSRNHTELVNMSINGGLVFADESPFIQATIE